MKKTRKKPAPSQANGSIISAYFRDENVKSNSERNTSKNFIPFTNKFAIKDTTAPIVNPVNEEKIKYTINFKFIGKTSERLIHNKSMTG